MQSMSGEHDDGGSDRCPFVELFGLVVPLADVSRRRELPEFLHCLQWGTVGIAGDGVESGRGSAGRLQETHHVFHRYATVKGPGLRGFGEHFVPARGRSVGPTADGVGVEQRSVGLHQPHLLVAPFVYDVFHAGQSHVGKCDPHGL